MWMTATNPDGLSSNVIPFDPIEEQLKREKLEAVQRENRKRAEEEAARVGRYVDAQAASAQMAKIAGRTCAATAYRLDAQANWVTALKPAISPYFEKTPASSKIATIEAT
jgi:hypothetical protein